MGSFVNESSAGWLVKPFNTLNLVLDGVILTSISVSIARNDVFEALSVKGYCFVFAADGEDINIELLHKKSVLFEVENGFNEILLSKSYSISELLSSIVTYKKTLISDILSAIQNHIGIKPSILENIWSH